MEDLIDALKQRARRLHRRARAGDQTSLAWLRRQSEFEHQEDPQVMTAVRRRHCLSTLARSLGFQGWPHAKAVLSGDPVEDLGTLMFRDACGAYWNIWSAHYEEAREIRRAHGGFLLPYRRHFQIVDEHYVRWLDLDPDCPEWNRFGRDWVRPIDRDAWQRLTARAIDARLTRTAPANI